MVSMLLRALVQPEIRKVQDAAKSAALMLAAVILLLAALATALVALALYLSLTLPGWQAVLIVAGVLMLLAMIVLVVALALKRPKQPEPDELGRLVAGLMGGGARKRGDGPARFSATDLAMAAAVLGIIFGGRRS